MMNAGSIAIGIGVMALATVIGYRMRTVSHSIIPFRDPLFLTIIFAEVLAMTLDTIGILPFGWMFFENDVLTVSDSGSVILIIMGAIDVGYIMGYAMCRPGDVIQLDMPSGSGYERSDIVPMVIYYCNGNRYVMPQTVGGIILSLLGARHPVDIPINEISRRRSYTVSNGGLRPPMEVYGAIVVSSHETEDYSVGLFRIGSRKMRDENRNIIAETPKYLIHATVTHHVVRFAWSMTDDYQLYQIKSGLYRDAMEDARDAEQRAARLEIQIQSLQFDAAADLIAGLISMTKDAPGAHDEIIDIIERARRSREEATEDADLR